MSGLSIQLESIGQLIRRLIAEHRDFALQTEQLDQGIRDARALQELSGLFAPLYDSLVNHMLVEETEIFPEVSSRGLFTERVSEIMQQHLDITAALYEMKFALHRKNLSALRAAFDELLKAIGTHFPAEESEVFSLLAQ